MIGVIKFVDHSYNTHGNDYTGGSPLIVYENDGENIGFYVNKKKTLCRLPSFVAYERSENIESIFLNQFESNK